VVVVVVQVVALSLASAGRVVAAALGISLARVDLLAPFLPAKDSAEVATA
jgi:hypothetical protein